MKQIALMRHAKSSWDNAELADIDRPLNRRGLRDAPMMGQRLADMGFVADYIVTSPATRAAVTARTIAEKIGVSSSAIKLEEDIYLADPVTLYQVMQQLDDSHQTVMLFGHNPGFTMLANEIGDASIDHMPTCSIAVFNLKIETWSRIARGCGELVFFDYPKSIREL
ncbi:MAG: histidine phosphatase family protein [Gammaproteobacteria bacterium]|nr:histidine phosphatase family protein [Gammaproteobacteria bacterium]MDH3768791.1 histidine phosphatase family protein [Gammaproteobacteria bacterium]